MTLNPGCKVKLQTTILTADSLEDIDSELAYFT